MADSSYLVEALSPKEQRCDGDDGDAQNPNVLYGNGADGDDSEDAMNGLKSVKYYKDNIFASLDATKFGRDETTTALPFLS